MGQTVLITNGRLTIALELARQLHRNGHRVIVADSLDKHVCRYSNSVDKVYKVPSPRFSANRYVDEIAKIAEKESVDLILPVWEEIFVLSHERERLPKSVRLFASTPDKLEFIHNKWSFFQKLEQHNIPSPRTEILTNDHASFEGLPVVIKECYSRGSERIYFVEDGQVPHGLEVDPGGWIIQDWIKGQQFCSFSVCLDGKVLAHTTYPVKFSIDGTSSLLYSETDHHRIKEWTKQFIEAEGFTGQVGFDFIETKDGKLYAVDCNPRCTGGVHLLADRGAIPNVFTEGQQCSKPPKFSRRQIGMGMLLYGWREAARKKMLIDYFKALFSVKEVVFDWKDPLPFFLQPWIIAYHLKDCWKTGLPIPEWFIHDISYNGRLRVQAKPSRRS